MMAPDPEYERKLQERALETIREATRGNLETLTELLDKVRAGLGIQQDLERLLSDQTTNARKLLPLRPQLTYLLDQVKQDRQVTSQLKLMFTEAQDVHRDWLPLRWAKNKAPRRVVVQNAADERKAGAGTLPLLVIVAKRKHLSDDEDNEPRKRARKDPQQPAALVSRDVTDLTRDDDEQ
jgi:hypothetical protein